MSVSWFCQQCLRDYDGEPTLNKELGTTICDECLKTNKTEEKTI